MTQIDRSTHEHLLWLAGQLFEAGIFAQEVTSVPRGFAVLLAGHEMGFAPMVSARSLCFVKNKLQLNAAAQVAVCVRHADICTYFRLVESSATKAVYTTLRVGHPEPVTLEYTIEQARTANLANGGTWKAHPASMLRARCSSALATAVYPDLVAGLVDPDEADEIRRVDGIPQIPARVPVRPDTAPRIDTTDSEQPAPANDAPAANPAASEALTTARHRLDAARALTTVTAIVRGAPVQEIERGALWTSTLAAATRLEVSEADLRASLKRASEHPATVAQWGVVAQVLVALDRATDAAGVADVRKQYVAQVMALPAPLLAGVKAATALRARELGAPTVATRLADEAAAAKTPADLRAIYSRLEAAAAAGQINEAENIAVTAALNARSEALASTVAA